MKKAFIAKKSTSSISQQDKERLKTLFAEFLNHKEFRELEHGWLRESDMMITLCAVYGKFDFSVVLEHFSELMSALKFIGRPNEFMSWEHFMIHYAAYCLLDCPLLNLTVGCSNDFKFMQENLDRLLFLSYYSYSRKKGEKILTPADLPESIQKALDNEDLEALFKKTDTDPEKLVADVTYTALLKEKWNVFAGIHARYDLTQYVNMEKIFDFWCRELLPNKLHYYLGSQETFDFPGQWNEAEKYPLHRMMIEYGRERCVPALYWQGFLLPELIEYLWNKGISFDAPLDQLYGWEKVTFPAFASCFGDLADKIELIPIPKYPQRGEMIFRQNVKSAAYFNKYSAEHPRQVSATPSILVKTKKGELTPEQKIRLANDEAHGVIFSEDKRILKQYAGCLGESEEWIRNGYSVPDFVTAIGAEAFCKMEYIKVKSIILPEGLTRIGPRAFQFRGIEKIVFPATLKTIGASAFYSTHLEKLILPDGIRKIGSEAFASCSRLKSVFLPDSLTEFGESMFSDSGLKDVRLPADLKYIPLATFWGCRKLETFLIPAGIEKLGVSAFRDCTALKSIFLPDSVTELGNAAFEGCASLTEVRLSPNLKVIPYDAFAGCTSLESIIIPDSVQEIGDRAFENCPNLRSVEVPKGIKKHRCAFKDHSPELKITYREPKKD